MNEIAEYGVPPQSTAPRKDRTVRTLFWLEWRRHRLGAVLALVFLVPIMVVCGTVESAGEGIFFWLTISMAWGIALGVGRVEWMEGEEEFQLTLPATRAQRYWVKFATGAAILAGCYAIGAATCFTDWFAAVGDALNMKEYDSGDLPFFIGRGPAFRSFALVFPLAAYAEFFALSATVSRRGDPLLAVRVALFLAAGLGLLLGGERWLGDSAGWLHAPLWLAWALGSALRGARSYERKDAVLEVRATGTNERQKALLVAGLLLALGLAFGLALVMYSR